MMAPPQFAACADWQNMKSNKAPTLSNRCIAGPARLVRRKAYQVRL